MKRSMIISVLLPLLIWAGASEAADPSRSWEGTILARALNVRAEPGKTQKIVAKLKRGDRVVAFDEKDKWVYIREFDDCGKTGWVSRSFITLPKAFMAPAFGEVENAFLEWASARGDLSVVSVEADNWLFLVLESDREDTGAVTVAREVACAYRAAFAGCSGCRDRLVHHRDSGRLDRSDNLSLSVRLRYHHAIAQ